MPEERRGSGNSKEAGSSHSVILTGWGWGWGWAADETCAGRGPVGRAVSVVQVGKE